MDAAFDAPLSEAEFASAVEILRRLIPEGEFTAYSLDVSPATVYTNLVTIWMLTLQRLGGGKSMAAIIKEVLAHNRDLLPDNKRVREGTLSHNSATYSHARKRLPLEMVEQFAESVCQSLIERTPSWFDDRRAYIIDGTTITLEPTSSLRDAYPPATNQHGETVWPVMMLMVAHELQSGCALVPEFGAMYGENNTSEARQALAIGQRIPRQSLVLADSNFGIFSVAWGLRQAGQSMLFRMTRSRFKSVKRQAEMVVQDGSDATYRLTWRPTKKDLQKNPDLPSDASLEVFLHEVEMDNDEMLYLVTNLAVSNGQAAEMYARRYDVEHDIRDMKVSLGIENIRAKSDEMVQKELLCSMVAYNLVVQLRREAAKIAGLPPRRLSFTGVWNTMQSYLLHQSPRSAEAWQARYEETLHIAAKDKLPNRPGRSYPRKAHPRRAKSTKFMKNQQPPAPPDPQDGIK